jgi:uncharacterized protein YgbK (DUF1537 family)
VGDAPTTLRPLVVDGARRVTATRLREESTRIVVLDDDPTGTQTVADVPVVLDHADEHLRWGLTSDSSVVFVLTNSRALAEPEAVDLVRDVVRRCEVIGDQLGLSLRFVSRSDSTLRGHFPAEVHAIADGQAAAGRAPSRQIVLCPCFIEAGRITADDVQWVRQDGDMVPAAQTEFASDAVFGYRSSDLRSWVAERTGGAVARDDVARITLDDLRTGGPSRVVEILEDLASDGVVVANATDYADLDVLTLGIADAEERGRRLVYRTGPSFVPARGGLAGSRPATASPDRGGRGLVVVGSHTELTTRQLAEARRRHSLSLVEIAVDALLNPIHADAEIARAVSAASSALERRDVALVTSRSVHVASDGAASLRAAALISEGLLTAVRDVVRRTEPRYLIAKGGITSSDLATRGLQASRATVLGQVFPGMVSVWSLEDGLAATGLPYVVFPGNVGGPAALADAIDLLAGPA